MFYLSGTELPRWPHVGVTRALCFVQNFPRPPPSRDWPGYAGFRPGYASEITIGYLGDARICHPGPGGQDWLIYGLIPGAQGLGTSVQFQACSAVRNERGKKTISNVVLYHITEGFKHSVRSRSLCCVLQLFKLVVVFPVPFFS